MSVAEPGSSRHRSVSFVGLALRDMFARQHTLAVVGSALLIAAVFTFGLSLIDTRTFEGVNVWIKPLKFMVSLATFALTSAWFVGYLQPDHRRRWPVRTIVTVITVASLFEIGYITVQAAQAEASHFNVGDVLHSVMYSLMGIGAVSLTATAAALAVLVARRGDPALSPPFKVSLILGLTMTFVLGTATGAFMSTQAGHFTDGLKAAPGIPLLGWSTVGGDWRVAHFFGMHAQQIVPAFGALVAWTQRRRGMFWLISFCAGYVLLILATFLQATMNLPFIAQ